MQLLSFSELIFYFTIYSVLGWLCETIYCSAAAGRQVNRGFLGGPWCPVYGFGAVLLILAAEPVRNHILVVFLISVVATTLLELFSGWLLEILFKTRWWDYSGRRFQIKGRICLRNSLLFGLLGMAVIYILQPLASSLLSYMDPTIQRVLASVILAILFLDLTHSLATVTKLDEQLLKLKSILQEMGGYLQSYDRFDSENILGCVDRLRDISAREPENKKADNILKRYNEQIRKSKAIARLLIAFPGLTPKSYSSEYAVLKNEWDSFREDSRCFENLRDILKAGWNKEWKNLRISYKDVTVTRMVWVFLIGSVIGYVTETLFFLATRGNIESRQGMIYGPFSQIYGFGAVVMVLVLSPFAHKGDGWLFVGGAVSGGLFETVSSLFQEICFGGISWEYSDQPLSLFGGRTSILFMCFWGILAVIYMKYIYPPTASLIDRIPKRPKYFFTWVITICLSVDLLLSVMALNRWSERIAGLPAKNSVEVWLDENYSNEKLREIYPSMSFSVH